MKGLLAVLCACAVVFFLLIASFGIVAGIAWLLCWCFGLDFSLKITLGVCLIAFLLYIAMRPYGRH